MERANDTDVVIPLVNSTEIKHILESKWITQGGKEEKVKDTIGVKGVFPRWIFSANLSHAGQDLSSIINIGDSKLEQELNVAEGFPHDILEENEMIIPQSFADYFGI